MTIILEYHFRSIFAAKCPVQLKQFCIFVANSVTTGITYIQKKLATILNGQKLFVLN